MIYGVSDEDDWTSEATWYKANPFLGETIDIEKVRNAYISARENVAEENIFRQLRLNQWVKQSTRWMQMDKWDACAFLVNEEELIGRTCYGGLDLSSTSDITAFVLATVYKGNIIKNLIMDCQSYTKYRPNETTGGIFVSWRRKEELPTGA